MIWTIAAIVRSAVAHGTVESERARVAKLPVAGELFGAMMITAMIFGK